MEAHGTERWLNPINEIALRQFVGVQEDNFAFAHEDFPVTAAYAITENETLVGTLYPVEPPIGFFVPATASDYINFQTFAKEWKARKRTSSRAQDIIIHPSYMRIVGMGKPAVPFILLQLQAEVRHAEPDHWFAALWAITGENPVPPASRGNLVEMAKAWIDWGVARGFLNANSMGAFVSQSW